METIKFRNRVDTLVLAFERGDISKDAAELTLKEKLNETNNLDDIRYCNEAILEVEISI